ncbi:hypothetical protein [Effusibacillus lacus]|uniref:Uncharacterized protein n=1 Tax=Effusibacillus lacus TaxID=1348429 RepID=A0A292YP85_9BACL|nr:hypothetical protein [Effusibacillus lacus]TCS68159.1 hypothetical protein EDD64_14511 [Effusibacillus lacus]GAX90290.1 hypothetical protein EFBL_1916 [Effusibacillus lacus]
MIIKILKYAGMAAVIGLLLQTMFTTYYLAKIDSGLNASLDSTAKLIEVQKVIIEKNGALQEVVETTKQMDQQLLVSLEATKTIHSNIEQINKWNYQTLVLNRNMMGIGAESDRSLQDISSGMSQLKQSTAKLNRSLARLKELVRQDRANLELMKQYTDEMNRKVPEVTP